MKKDQSQSLTPELLRQLEYIGGCLARLRMETRVRQQDAAMRAGMSRSTAALIERGAPSVAVGQIIRYLDAISPRMNLASLLAGDNLTQQILADKNFPKRARTKSAAELAEFDI
jgi:transcriptional regulator with XRE-family HTH domain